MRKVLAFLFTLCISFTIIVSNAFAAEVNRTIDSLMDITYDGSTELTSEVIIGTMTGDNKRLIKKSDEVWSRENTNHNVNATTPQPPTGAPNV